MPRLPLLTPAAALLALAPVAAGYPTNAHFDPTKFPRPCSPCHKGHGVPGTPELSGGTREFCLKCHESASKNAGRRAALSIGAAADPQDIRTEYLKPVRHDRASCFDCHSAHSQKRLPAPGFQNLSTKRAFLHESDLCLSCHGTRGPRGPDPQDLSKLFLMTNPSFHPVVSGGHAVSVPSLLPPYTLTSLMNCVDCHTNDDPAGPRGPHGSRVPNLLGKGYWTTDGQPESEATYALCYGCHSRASILSDVSFTGHSRHVVGARTSCATCHNPHGAVSARFLIRFNDPAPTQGVTASASGRLEYISVSPGSGACFLTCHGKNHDPLTYGGGVQSAGFRKSSQPLLRGDVRKSPLPAAPAPLLPEQRKPPEAPKR